MIDGIRCVTLFVPDVAASARWYEAVLDCPPMPDVSGTGACFTLNGYELTLRPGDAPCVAAAVYWSVDNLDEEVERLAQLGAQVAEPAQRVDEYTRQACVRDPGGNLLGLVERHDPSENKVRSQRAAEKIALRRVRETLDTLASQEAETRRLRRVMWGVAGAVVVVGGALLLTMVPDRSSEAGRLSRVPAPTASR